MEQQHLRVCELQMVLSVQLWSLQAAVTCEVAWMTPVKMARLVLQMLEDQIASGLFDLAPFLKYLRAESGAFVPSLASAEPPVGRAVVLVWQQWLRSCGLRIAHFASRLSRQAVLALEDGLRRFPALWLYA